MRNHENAVTGETVRYRSEQAAAEGIGFGADIAELERLLQIVPLTPLEHELAGAVITLSQDLTAKAGQGGAEVVRALPNLWDLTEREREVLELIVEGRTNRDAARELRISPRTIEVHRASLRAKMQAETTAAMVTKVFLAERVQSNPALARLSASLGGILRARLLDSIEHGTISSKPDKAARPRTAASARRATPKAGAIVSPHAGR